MSQPIGPSIYEINRGGIEYRWIENQAKQTPSVFGDGMIPLAPVCTLIYLPPVVEQPAARLLALSWLLDGFFAKQFCTETIGRVEVKQFITLTPQDGQFQPVLEANNLAHLFAHLILGLVEQRALQRYPVRIEDRLLRHEAGLVLFFNNAFEQPAFEDLVRSVWHWLNQALTKGVFPSLERAHQLLDQRLELLQLSNVLTT